MKLAFNSIANVGWDLPTLVMKAKEYGYQGIELRGLSGQMELPLASELAASPARIAGLIRDTGVELVCLSSAASFHMPNPAEVAQNLATARAYIELAARLSCPMVRVFAGEIPRGKILYERRETVLGRIANALRTLVPVAAENGVTVVVENGGDFSDSAALWYLVDAVDSPVVQCCWSPFAARSRMERPTISIPRLGTKIAMVHVCDGKFAANGGLESYATPGQGDLEIPRMVQLLKGIAYQGYLVVDWPKLWVPSLAEADKVLPAAAKFLQPLINEKPLVMTAYKGDKNAPRQGLAAVN